MPYSLRYRQDIIKTGEKMIIFTRADESKIAIRPSSIVSVEDCPQDPKMSFVSYVPNRQQDSIEEIRVKHTVQEVVDALHKVEVYF